MAAAAAAAQKVAGEGRTAARGISTEALKAVANGGTEPGAGACLRRLQEVVANSL